MSQFVESPVKTYTATSAIGQYLRAKLSSGEAVLAGAGDRGIGVTEFATFNAGDPVAVRLPTAEGTQFFKSAGTIAVDAKVYAAAAGEVSATRGPVFIGIAQEAAVDGDVFEVLVTNDVVDVGTVAAAGSVQGDATALGETDIVDVTGGDDTKGVILPTAVAGARVEVRNSGTAGLKIYPATGADINGGSANAAITILEDTHATFVAISATSWAAQYTVNS